LKASVEAGAFILPSERLANHDRSARRVLERIAVRVGRARTSGRPILWKAKGGWCSRATLVS